MSNVKNVIALTQETVANSTTGDVNTDDNTLFVDKSANRVGIQTNTPDVTLHIQDGVIKQQVDDTANLWSDINSSVNPYTPMSNELVIQNDALNTANSMASIFFKAGQTTEGLQINSARIAAIRESGFNTSLVFSTRATSPGGHTEKMRITSDGKVGVGFTTGLSNTLNVDGTGRFTGNVTADYYHGNGSELTGISAGATGGGGDQVFVLSDQNVTTDYSIPAGKNALSAGPLTVNTGVTVTIPSGSAWTIV